MMAELKNKLSCTNLGMNKNGMDLPTMILFAFGLLCITVPLELSQLSFAFVGALAYMAVHSTKKAASATRRKSEKNLTTKNVRTKACSADEIISLPRRPMSKISSAARPREKKDVNM